MSLSPELVSFLESLPEPHILFDRGYRILAANAAYRREFSPDGSALGRTCHAVSHRFEAPCDQSGESCPLARARESGQRERVLHLHHTPRGEAYVDIELTPVRDASGEIAYFVEKMEPLKVSRDPGEGGELIGRSEAFRKLMALVARVAPSSAAVLLHGESGTGKELVARAIHAASARASRPLVVVDCASLAENLFESELFGHERGAFTGATAARAGLVEAADGGTLFLDEVGDIPPTMQVKLLRLLESGTYRRVGSTELRHADLRIVSATHRDLQAMIAEGGFRQDLFFRLAVFPIHLPALRERRDDIPALAEALLERVSPARRLRLSAAALERLAGYDFPGNVRELRNLLERAALLCDGPRIELAQVEQALETCKPVSGWESPARGPSVPGPSVPGPSVPGPSIPAAPATSTLKALELAALREQLRSHHGSRAELARQLGISERSLYRKLRALQQAERAAANQKEEDAPR
ncbi:sigma-54-dependent Fis family transcriptional regulator [Burkholderiaceae bacterium FT117]|uniref:sigma-54 interaction domain-containing protein n=1 Tax=Zeimonas sediminis TaxID=2944268 RepID=UPI002343027C|nr:sigma-54-dependent Fis family transcriptional regulator [Zeimonas sediminis]MCM5569296.1 sigma-54-dependent Fis family transcriptional regulator [Zeimonas sediminis]